MKRGEFGGKLHGSSVYFPAKIEEIIRTQNLHSLEEFLSYAHSFPTSVAEALGWTIPEVNAATEALLVQCKDILDPRFVEIFHQPPQNVSFGALIPE